MTRTGPCWGSLQPDIACVLLQWMLGEDVHAQSNTLGTDRLQPWLEALATAPLHHRQVCVVPWTLCSVLATANARCIAHYTQHVLHQPTHAQEMVREGLVARLQRVMQAIPKDLDVAEHTGQTAETQVLLLQHAMYESSTGSWLRIIQQEWQQLLRAC